MIKTLGADVIAETLQKDDILEGAIVPDVEKDKADKVPAYITGWKQKVLNSIGRTPTLVSKEGRYNRIIQVDEDVLLPFLTNYGDYLRAFVKELADVKTHEQAGDFVANHLYEFTTIEATEKQKEEFGNPNYVFSVRLPVLGRTIKSAITDIRDYERTVDRKNKIKEILEGGVKNIDGYSDGKTRYQSIESYGTDSTYTTTYQTKQEAEKALKEKRESAEKWVKETEERLNDNYDYYLPKRKVKEEKTDLSHGNFKPLERVERSEPDIPENKINPETLTKEMGFKSVQLGNYMDDPTAKEHLRYTIGAVKDMSKLLNIDFPTLINKMGLSIAFGARGGGRFNAHYEPSHNIINLTKGSGDGSFFHEFVHFLDWTTNKDGYRGKWSGGKTRYYRGNDLESSTLELMQALTGEKLRRVKEFVPEDNARILDDKEHYIMTAYARGESIESRIATAKRSSYPGREMQNIADVYRQTIKEEVDVYNERTDFYKNSKQIGGGSADSYWVRPHELLARAGQAYIDDKMIKVGMKNNYLTRSTIGEGNKAYPQGEERKMFEPYFDKVFAVLAERYPATEVKPQFRLSDLLKEKPETNMTEAGKYLAEVKKRLNFDFDVHFADSLLTGYESKIIDRRPGRREAWGVTIDNTIVLAKEMARHTAPHEVVHLTLLNMEKMPIFKSSYSYLRQT